MLRTVMVSESQTAFVPRRGNLVSRNTDWREITRAQTHTDAHSVTALCPHGCLLLGDKAGFYVAKRLVSEPGVQGEPHSL